jgi:hypothetical protein
VRLIHEFGHQYGGDHLSEEYHDRQGRRRSLLRPCFVSGGVVRMKHPFVAKVGVDVAKGLLDDDAAEN